MTAPDSTANRPKISACIVCRNEADKLKECLRSLGWVDEIVVVDLVSDDESTLVASQYGARVVSHTPVPYVELVRQTAIDAASGDWVLILDPDERVEPRLGAELRRLAKEDLYDAVEIPVSNYYLGAPAKYEGQRFEPHVRMFRRTALHWPRVIHGLPSLAGLRVCRLPHRDDLVIVHDSWHSVPEVLERFVRYVPAEARGMVESGMVFSLRSFLLNIIQEIDLRFFVERSWRDGVPGVLRAALFVSYRLFIWAMFWQLTGSRRSASDDRWLRIVGVPLDVARRLAAFGGYAYRFMFHRGPRT